MSIELRGPLLASLSITRECNLKCNHCYASGGTKADNELNTEELLNVIDQFIESGALNFDFLGGEPFMRTDLTALIERCIERGIHVNVTTNGTKLSRAWLDKFDKKLGLLRIALDSVDPEKHDSFRGVQGAWAETIKGIRSAVERGVNVTVVTTFHRRNVHELDQLVDFMLELGVNAYANTILLPSGRGAQLNEDVLSPSELRAFCLAWGQKRSKLQEKKLPLALIDEHPLTTLLTSEKGYEGQHYQVNERLSKGRACTAGFIQAHMTPSGHLIPCGGMEGISELHTDDNDVRKRSVNEIWMNSWIFRAMRDRMYQDRPFSIIDKCKECKYLPFCGGGCRAASYLKYGDFYHTDPQCWYDPEGEGDIHDRNFNI